MEMPYDELLSALQKSIRRCLWPAAGHWALQLHKNQTPDLFRNLLLYCCEDIGPANPSLILLIDDLLDLDTPHENIDVTPFMLAVQVMTKSPKSKIFTWLCEIPIVDDNYLHDNVVDNALHLLLLLEIHLEEENFDEAVSTARKYHEICVQNNVGLSSENMAKWWKIFNPPVIVGKLSRLTSLFWLPVLRVMHVKCDVETCILVCRLYHICCRRSSKFSFRSKEGYQGFWMYAIWVLCNKNSIVETWALSNKHFLIADIDPQLKIHLDIKIADYALDMTTARGRRMKRTFDHYVLESAKIAHVCQKTVTMEYSYLKKVAQANNIENLPKLEAYYALQEKEKK